MQPMGYAGVPAGASYEFNDFQNATIGSTARFARLWGIISLASGVLLLVGGILLTALFMGVSAVSSGSSPMLKPALIAAIGVSLIPTSLVSILGGIFYMSSGASLQRVVDTQGSDIPLLMDAVKSLSRAFMIEAIAMLVSFVVGLVIGILMQVGGST